jgi:hypothetical protein
MTDCEWNYKGRTAAALAKSSPGGANAVALLKDHCQKRLFPTTIGGGVTVKSSDKWRVTSKASPKQIFEICRIGLR